MLFYSLNYTDLVRLESDFEVINKEKGALATQLSCTHTELATLRSELDSKIGKHKKLDGSFHSVVLDLSITPATQLMHSIWIWISWRKKMGRSLP